MSTSFLAILTLEAFRPGGRPDALIYIRKEFFFTEEGSAVSLDGLLGEIQKGSGQTSTGD